MATMQPFKTAYSLLLLAAASLSATSANASQDWLERVNEWTQHYIFMVESTVPFIAQVSQNRFDFVKDSRLDANESENKLNRLIEKLVAEEYSPYDFIVYNEITGVLGSNASKEQDPRKEAIRRHPEIVQHSWFSAMLVYSNDSLDELGASYESLIFESGKTAWSQIAEFKDVQQMAIRSRFSVLAAAETLPKDAMVQPAIEELTLVFGRSVIVSLDLSAIKKPSDAPFATWEEVRLLAMKKYAIPHSTWHEFQSFLNLNHEVRISKGYLDALR